MLRVYIAAPWSQKATTARDTYDECQIAGLEVTSRWIDREVLGFYSKNELRDEANADLEDLSNSDMFILLNTQDSGGKMFETGVAYALGLPVIIVGDSTNIFCNLEEITIVDSVKRAIEVIHVKGAEWEEGTWGSDDDGSEDRGKEGIEVSKVRSDPPRYPMGAG